MLSSKLLHLLGTRLPSSQVVLLEQLEDGLFVLIQKGTVLVREEIDVVIVDNGSRRSCLV